MPECLSLPMRGARAVARAIVPSRPSVWRRWGRDRRGAVALMVGVMTPAMLGFLGLTVDAGFWVMGQTRLQVAADAGAMGASFLLTSANFKAMSAATRQSTAQAVALAEAQGAMTKMMGTLVTPATVSVASDYSSVTVTLYSQAGSYFPNIFNIGAPLMRAAATASVPAVGNCVLALNTSGNALMVDNGGTIAATSCTVASKANIYLNSGTITATKVLAAGTVSLSNSGSNTMTPAGTSNATVPSDPYATSRTAPTPGACANPTDNYASYGTWTAKPATWCGDQTIGGNGSTISFQPGVYIINNGNLTFSNAQITSATGVTFVLTGTKPGNFSWTNNSSSYTISAPTDGSATSGIAIWQVCNTNGLQTASFQGGSTLNLSGAAYFPCAAVDIGNNAQIKVTNATINLIGSTVYVHGSAQLRPTGSSASTTVAATVLTK